VKFSGNGRYIISCGKDNQIKIWEIEWEWIFQEGKKTTVPKKKTPLSYEEKGVTITAKPELKTTTLTKKQEKKSINKAIFLLILLIPVIYFLYLWTRPIEVKMKSRFEKLCNNYPSSINSMTEQDWTREKTWWLTTGKIWEVDPSLSAEFLYLHLLQKIYNLQHHEEVQPFLQ